MCEWAHKGGKKGVSLVISDVTPTLQGGRVRMHVLRACFCMNIGGTA